MWLISADGGLFLFHFYFLVYMIDAYHLGWYVETTQRLSSMPYFANVTRIHIICISEHVHFTSVEKTTNWYDQY